MMDFLRKYQVHILGGVLAFFVLSIALGFGTSFFVKGAPNDVIAKVDGDEITLRTFMTHYNRALDAMRQTAIDDNARQQKQQETLRDLVQLIVFKRQADLYGIQVPDSQVVNSIAQVPQFRNDKGAFDPQLYGRFLQYQAKTSASDFEEEQRQSIAFFKLRWLIQSCVRVTDDEVARAWSERGAEFAKQNASEPAQDGKPKRLRSPAEIQDLFRRQLIEEKSMWALNQWFQEIGKRLRVKTYLERLPAGGR